MSVGSKLSRQLVEQQLIPPSSDGCNYDIPQIEPM